MRKALALIFIAAVGSSCGPEKEDYTKQKPPEVTEKPKEMAPPPKKVEVPTELGKCALKATGAMQVDQVTEGGRAATNVSYWLTDEERRNMMGVDGFVITCQGEKMRFQIVPGGGNPEAMPFSPKKYEIKKGRGEAMVNIGFGSKQMIDPSGTIDITAFDSRHIAGTVDITGKVDGKETKVSGNFDLICPGFKGCKYE